MADHPTQQSPVDGRPRPQLWRAGATSLDGPWDFAADPAGRWQRPADVEWQTTIVVPFSPGTPASGVADTGPGLAWWYRRRVHFDAGSGSDGDEQVLHVGAVDWAADVWVDGEHVAHAEGGYTPLRVRLRGTLASAGEHEVVVRAVDDPTDLAKPRGKQTWEPDPRAIWYPGTSGIWQPVWTERLSSRSLDSLWWQPDVPRSALALEARLHGPTAGCRLHVRLAVGDRVLVDDIWTSPGSTVQRAVTLDRGAADLEAEDLLWSPRTPVLIDARLRLLGPDDEVLDEVESYAGLRSVGTDGGRLLLNGHPFRHRLVLDQGYWPETGMTAPSDDALRHDVELTKELGFNGVRKHQKVEDPRYLGWADRLGLLVWAELPSAYRFDDVAVTRALRLWPEAVVRDRSHPCVVGWVPVNESWGVRDVAARPEQRAYVRALVATTRALDPHRPLIANDGWEAVGGDVLAVHDYDLDPERLGRRWAEPVGDQLTGYGPLGRRLVLDDADGGGTGDRPVLLSEFGGMSFDAEGWGYARVDSPEAFAELYERLLASVRSSPHLSGFCYTQLTDTYQETNGLLYADRSPKAPIERLRAATRGRAGPAAAWPGP